jgi:flagellin
MRIQNNIPALNTHRQYGINNANVAKNVEKLSSGYRINRAGDDAAGLAISEKMRAQIRGLNMASKNSQDAVSMIQTAEGALQSTHNVLQRMRELAVQSASDTNEQVIDRGALEAEFAQLKAEIDDTAAKTRFNDQNLIDGTFQKKVSSTKVTNASVGTKILGIAVEAAKSGTYAFSATLVAPVTAGGTAGTPSAITNVGDFNYGTGTGAENVIVTTSAAFTGINTGANNNNAYTFKVDGGNANSLTISLIDTQGTTVTSLTNVDATKWGGTVSLNFSGVGTLAFNVNADTSITGDANGASAVKGQLNGKQLVFNNAGVTPNPVDAQQGKIKLTLAGEDVFVEKGDTVAKFKETGIVLSFKAIADADAGYISSTGAAVAGTAGNAFATGTVNIVVDGTKGQDFIVQSGANEGDTLNINIDAMNTARLGISYSKISTQEDAAHSITEVNTAINKVSTQRAALGAFQNRLDFKIANLDTSAENLQAAEGRIRDVDMAKEMTQFMKNNMLAQASTAMLAQANSLPQGVLQLLG